MLDSELLARLRKGRKPGIMTPGSNEALFEAGVLLGVVPGSMRTFAERGSLDLRNATIDLLDKNYPGWRGYAVPETEGSHD